MSEETIIQEKRVKSNVIRRRRKTVPAEETKPTEDAVNVAVEAKTEEREVKQDSALSEAKEVATKSSSLKKKSVSTDVQDKDKLKSKQVDPKGEQASKADEDGPAVGTIIKLPSQKKKPATTTSEKETTEEQATPLKVFTPESDLEQKLSYGKKKNKPKNIGADISEYGGVNQLRRVFIQDRVFEPTRQKRAGKKKIAKGTGKKTLITTPKASKRIVEMGDEILVSEFAHRIGVKGAEIIKKLMAMGTMASLNQNIDFDTAFLIAQDYQWEVKKEQAAEEIILSKHQDDDSEEDLMLRAPVVTVMGHVDHGKTSLLDYIRNSRVAAKEAGGITQHIGAYRVTTPKGEIAFLDTPGHEAFTAMRARGAQATDIVILVVAADDGVKPQTVEALNHAKAAGVPIVVAVNKIDKPEADPEKPKRQLAEHGVTPEEWGGETPFVNVSAHTGEGIDDLLEHVSLQAEVLELKANPNKLAKGVVVEAQLNRSRGILATVLVQSGTLKLGDSIVAGTFSGKVKALINDQGQNVKEAGPSTPVEVLGLLGVPDAGDEVLALKDDKDAKRVAEERGIKNREERLGGGQKLTLEDLFSQMEASESFELPLVIKGDVQGSVEALRDAFEKLQTEKVKVRVILSGVGGITESDIMLASTSNALLIGFNVRPETKAIQLAKDENVDVNVFNVIYDATDTVRKAMEGLLPDVKKENYLGRAEVRQVFDVSKLGKAAGCYVNDGLLRRNAQIRILRDNIILFEGSLTSLKRFKDDAKEVKSGYECGLALEGFADLRVGDVIESFEVETHAAKL